MKWLKKVASTPLTTIAKVIDSLSGGTNERTNAPSIKAVNDALDLKQNYLNFDTEPTEDSTNPVTSGGLLDYLKSEFLETVYPVGSIYLAANSTNPATLFGGTWERVSGSYLYASDSTVTHGTGATGGNELTYAECVGTIEEHVLTVDEIPSHRHDYIEADGVLSGNLGVTNGGQSVARTLTTDVTNTGYTGGGAGHTHEFTGGYAQVVLNPTFYCVACWKRTA